MLKCSRCRHIFPAERTQRAVEAEAETEDTPLTQPAPAPPPAPPAVESHQEDLDLNFDEPPTWEGEQAELPSFREDENYSLGTGTGEAHPGARARDLRRGPRLLSEVDGTRDPVERTLGHEPRRGEEAPAAYSFDDVELEDGESASREDDEVEEDSEGDEEQDEQTEYDVEEDTDVPRREDEVRRARRWLVPLGLFFSIVVAAYFFLAQELIRDREFAEVFIARLPMVGSSLAADRLLFRKVALNEVEGAFVRVKQGKEVFVISGTALNTASRPLRNVRIEGSLNDPQGGLLQQEAITLGGMDARRLLQGLSLREVEMLGQVEPSRKFRLEPGDSTSFAIVFTNAPAAAAQFSARVASAQR